VSLSFLGNVMAGVYGLSFVNIPMFFCLRRLCTVFIYSYDIFVLKQPVIMLELVSIGFICSGTIIAGLNDLTFDITGYVLVMLNNMLTTINF